MKHIKRKIIEIATKSQEGHIASAFSILDILWVLYDKVLNISPETVDRPERDILVLSKGHSSIGLYAVLAEKGFIKRKIFETFAQFESVLGGHPDRTKIPGIEASTGSLGHGFPMAVGIALAKKIRKQKGKVYAIVGDGECNEGTIWESALLAAYYKLKNLYCVVDYNHSNDRSLVLGNLKAKFESFGWRTVAIDGHSHKEIYKALTQKSKDKPIAIIAETIKGKGVKRMEHNPEWHHKAPKPEELKIILKELE
jgi:transketolase